MHTRHLVFMLMNAIAASSVQAQNPDRRPPPPPPPSEMAQKLGLDATTTTKFVAILEEQRTKHRALHDAAETDRAAMRQKMDALHEETLARLKTVLNADQIARFEALRPKPPGPGDGQGRPHGPPPGDKQS